MSSYRRPFFVLLGVAVLLLAVGIAVVLNPGPRWKVASTQAAFGNVVIEQNPVPADDVKSLDDALVPGSTLEWDGSGELLLVSRRHLALAVAPGTKMTLPLPPPRWFARTTRCTLERGTIAFTAGPRFEGARVAITTPETTVEMKGTTLAASRRNGLTTVSVLEGEAYVGRVGTVAAGGRALVTRRGTERAELQPEERAQLVRMKSSVREDLYKGGD